MAWCPNCDEIRDVAADTPCPVCSATTLDAGRLRAPASTGAAAVLELEPETPPATRGEAAAFSVTAPSRRKLIAGLVVAAIAAGGIGAVELTSNAKPKVKTTAAPEESSAAAVETSPTIAPAPQPPFGLAMPGVLTLVGEDHITRVDLTTGAVINAATGENAGWFKALSRDGRAFAYRDDPGMLWVVPNLGGTAPFALVSDVADYTFADDASSVIVHRTEFVSNVITRSRIERRTLDFSRTDLLFETNRPVGGIWWRRGTLLVRMSDGRNDGIYEVTGRTKARLIRNKASVFDVSLDGEKLLVGPERTGPGLWVVDIATRAAKPVGPSNLLVNSAAFSANGKAIALAGTTDFEIGETCGDGHECGTEYMPNSSMVYRAEAGSKTLKKLFAGADLTGVTWGPADWIFFNNNGAVTATRGDGTDRIMSVTVSSPPSFFAYTP